MSKLVNVTAAAAFAAGLLAAPVAALAQAPASTGNGDNAASQRENYKVRDQQGASSGGGSSVTSPAPTQSGGSGANAAAQDENYKVREGQNATGGSATGTGGKPKQATDTRN
ncbi:hypothetical protein ACFQI3_13640 [Hansschlegelia quercus]|uniref:Uncharacterized protein n=1 Tax=Hansschlegelia quercus TaxID=2528245 RepID=A0A4Q9GAI7_9HYPH|nr:hypothetical protein [Hansschlegelia quercus]TBN47908.1 hypothetical protein EYR15_14905 [Hansschlegelia quercus]